MRRFVVTRIFSAPRDVVWKRGPSGAIERIPYDATDEERNTFEAGRDGMKQGWTGAFDQLDAYLAAG